MLNNSVKLKISNALNILNVYFMDRTYLTGSYSIMKKLNVNYLLLFVNFVAKIDPSCGRWETF